MLVIRTLVALHKRSRAARHGSRIDLSESDYPQNHPSGNRRSWAFQRRRKVAFSKRSEVIR
jgi:hypothetical protein